MMPFASKRISRPVLRLVVVGPRHYGDMDAIVQARRRRLAGTGCVTLVITPESNLRAARAAVD
jgi:hypothetical protein